MELWTREYATRKWNICVYKTLCMSRSKSGNVKVCLTFVVKIIHKIDLTGRIKYVGERGAKRTRSESYNHDHVGQTVQ